MATRVSLSPSRELVSVAWADGTLSEFATAWLIDNAPAAREGVAGQRLSTAEALCGTGPVTTASIEGDRLRLGFVGSETLWPLAILRACAHPGPSPPARERRTAWPDGAVIAGRSPHPYAAYATDDPTLGQALAEVDRFGLSRLSGAGAAEDELERVVARFGHIRETNYGRLFAVRTTERPDNLAYTTRALEPHTDNPYRDPAPTLQLLHSVRSAEGGGGETFFLDGVALAEDLRRSAPEAFATLAGTAVPFAFTTAAGERYEARSPIIRCDPVGSVVGIRFNHRSLGALDLGARQTASWYAAYLTFAAAAAAPRRRFAVRLEPGDIVVFDNERLLHGREAFSGAGGRLLMGCYADRDGLLATLARLRVHAHTA